MAEEKYNNRVLIVDDNPSIHDDFRKILEHDDEHDTNLDDLLAEVLGEDPAPADKERKIRYKLDHAYQGEEAYEKVLLAEEEKDPYALLFMDVRMPPGWDGVRTIKEIWQKHPYNEIVICTAYSDYSWEEILAELGTSDQLQFLRKPFDVVSIKQMALAICKKWNLARRARNYVQDLENDVEIRTKELNDKIAELEKAFQEINELQGILPICAWCMKVRSDDNFWVKVDEYISNHTKAEISHGICPDCYDKMLLELEESKDG
ncbi:MAG: response regulator [Lentisphaeria bacterium]|nr:response regulator [Lentisphaeria bacterium]NQZ71190.1 response regulator [Lentisphaeria bacterium]